MRRGGARREGSGRTQKRGGGNFLGSSHHRIHHDKPGDQNARVRGNQDNDGEGDLNSINRGIGGAGRAVRNREKGGGSSVGREKGVNTNYKILKKLSKGGQKGNRGGGTRADSPQEEEGNVSQEKKRPQKQGNDAIIKGRKCPKGGHKGNG